MIRALYRSCQVRNAAAPYDNITLKIYYRAAPDGGEEQHNAGLIPADRSETPSPVVIIMPGINVGPESYAWLARQLAEAGLIAVTYSWIAEEMPGYVSLTPGIAVSELTPERYRQTPSATGLADLLDTLAAQNADGVLAGCLNLDCVVLAGHSAGGSLALFNADAEWFPAVKGAFSYGAHAGAATALGYPPETVLPLPDGLPMILVGGNRDGVIAASAGRYGAESGDALQPLRRTFELGFSGRRGDCHLIEIDGANHFSMAYPTDDTTGRPYLDQPTTQPDEDIRALLGRLLTTFAAGLASPGKPAITSLKDDPLIVSFESR